MVTVILRLLFVARGADIGDVSWVDIVRLLGFSVNPSVPVGNATGTSTAGGGMVEPSAAPTASGSEFLGLFFGCLSLPHLTNE